MTTGVTTHQTTPPSGTISSHVFKVGDEVKVVSADGAGCGCVSGGFNKTFIGKIAKVTGICTAHLTLEFEDTGNGWAIKACDVAPATYTPAVGDVVEFECKGRTCYGLVFWLGNSLGIAACYDDEDRYAYSNSISYSEALRTAKRIGNYSQTEESKTSSQACRAAKAYFAAKSPVFSGTYKERQAQWIKHYGLDDNSKVKIMRLAVKGEGGWDGTCAITNPSLIGEVVPIGCFYSETSAGISLHGKGNAHHLPYFCLEPA